MKYLLIKWYGRFWYGVLWFKSKWLFDIVNFFIFFFEFLFYFGMELVEGSLGGGEFSFGIMEGVFGVVEGGGEVVMFSF